MSIYFFVHTFITECMSMLPFRLLAVYLFRKHFRVPAWGITAAAIVLQAVQAAAYAVIIRSPYNVQWSNYGFGFLFFFFLFFCLKCERWRLLNQYIFVIDYEITAQGISQVFDARLFEGPRQHTDAILTALITLILFVAGVPFIVRFFKKSNALTSGIQASFFWRTVWLIPTINTLIVLMYTSESTRESLTSLRYLISRLLLFFSMFLVYVILMRILAVIRREATLEERAAKQEEVMAAERTRQEQLERYVLEMRRAKHDNIQHMRVMKGFIDKKEYEGLESYMAQYEASLPQGPPKTWCANQAANIMISYYAGECQSHGIEFTAEAVFPEKLAFSETDICSILGNLLENALAECIKISSEKQPAIKLRAKADQDELILTVDNTCEAPPQMDGEAFISTKHDGLGIGTVSIRSTAEKYHGRADFRYEDHMFYASVLLFAPGNTPLE